MRHVPKRPQTAPMSRTHWLRRIDALDPVRDYVEITRITAFHEFPWDSVQALSFALFRTYAVPSIGVLLHDTGEFTERTQKRYDDTVLILDAIGEHGLDSGDGKEALRRMNRMHAMYDISADDLRYVLATFVTCPIRWIDTYGWRPLVEKEKIAATVYYRELGRHMGIKDMPETWQEFGALMDDYEAEHFAYDGRARAVADSTLRLFATFPPFHLAPTPAVLRFTRAYMDAPLLDAFGYAHPTRAERLAALLALRARSAYVKRTPPRLEPRWAREMPQVRSYPGGYAIAHLGTFPAGAGDATG